ncbi:MAG: response regulator transcription factor [Bacteroidetes bacterium]|nr:response regulator transcription factor [Bacteroidota bacterium]
MRAVLVDDDRLNTDLLINLLQKYCPGVLVVGTAETVDEALEVIVAQKPDLLFLDIELHNRSAKDILHSLNLEKMQIILITAFDRYALEMYKFNVVDYLLKPLAITDLISAVNKAFKNIEKNKIVDTNQLQQTSERYIALPEKDHMNITKMNDIIRLEAKNSYTQVFTKENKIIISSKSLSDYEDLLPRHLFIRVHNSHIVNIQFILRYLRTKNGSLVMSDHTEIPISANRKKEVTGHIVF